MAREPCMICEDETAPGGPLYASRIVVARDGERGFVCEDCVARSTPERRDELSPAELARLEASLATFGSWWGTGWGG